MTYSVTLSEDLYNQLEQQAMPLHRSVTEWVVETVKRKVKPLVAVEGDLPPWLQSELLAMQNLSDMALWALARSSMPKTQQEELARLNESGGEKQPTPAEQERQQVLLNEYDETVLRRAHAATLLKARGYDMSDPSVLQSA